MSITIVTVAGPNDGHLIERNVRLIERMNPGVAVTQRVVDNSRHSGGTAVDESDRWELFDGVPLTDPGVDPRAQASSQHGMALNRCLAARTVKTRFLLILDPDFFIYYDHWVAEVTEYMESRGLAFFGAPWHPRWFTKYRGFPCVHCLFIDTKQVDVSSLDFLPRLTPSVASMVQSIAARNKLTRNSWGHWLSYVYSITLLRLDIGRAQDTGSRIYQSFRRDRPPVELLVPHMRPTDFHGIRHLRGRVGRFLERLWPDRLSFIPKKRGYFSRCTEVPAGFDVELTARGWEEFQWHGRLFGIHMRRFAAHGCIGSRSSADLLDAMEDALIP